MRVIVDPQVEAYVERLTSQHEPLLADLTTAAHEQLTDTGMLTGPVAGRFLETLVWIARPQRVLEIGTYAGHSALAIAAALPPGGHVDTCEVDPERAAFAQSWFDRSGLGDRITLHLGPALETVARLDGELDLVFVDADKTGYVDYYEAVLPRLAPHGVIVADNTLRDGRVVDLRPEDDPIARFNEHVAADPRSVQVVVPIRDGMTLIRRA